MLYIVVLACLATDMEACSERYIPVYADVSPLACAFGAQMEIARWKEAHRGLIVSGWRCQTDDMIEAAAVPRAIKAKQQHGHAK